MKYSFLGLSLLFVAGSVLADDAVLAAIGAGKGPVHRDTGTTWDMRTEVGKGFIRFTPSQVAATDYTNVTRGVEVFDTTDTARVSLLAASSPTWQIQGHGTTGGTLGILQITSADASVAMNTAPSGTTDTLTLEDVDGNAKTVNVMASTGAGATTLNMSTVSGAGAKGVEIATGGTGAITMHLAGLTGGTATNTVHIGSGASTGACTVQIANGTGATSNRTVGLANGNTTSGTTNIEVATDTGSGAKTVNIATGAGTGAITMSLAAAGAAAVTNDVTIASGTNTGATTVGIATGTGSGSNKTINIATGNTAAGTTAVNIATSIGAGAKTINIGDSTGAGGLATLHLHKGTMQFHDYTGAGATYVGLQAGVSDSTTYTLPAARPTAAGQFLTSTAANPSVMSWVIGSSSSNGMVRAGLITADQTANNDFLEATATDVTTTLGIPVAFNDDQINVPAGTFKIANSLASGTADYYAGTFIAPVTGYYFVEADISVTYGESGTKELRLAIDTFTAGAPDQVTHTGITGCHVQEYAPTLSSSGGNEAHTIGLSAVVLLTAGDKLVVQYKDGCTTTHDTILFGSSLVSVHFIAV
jgi:hypothetical protein